MTFIITPHQHHDAPPYSTVTRSIHTIFKRGGNDTRLDAYYSPANLHVDSTTLQKLMLCGKINCLEKCFNVCHILYIR